MGKFASLFILLTAFVHAGDCEQLVVIVAKELNSTTASLQRYEKEGEWHKIGEAVSVILGRSGLGWAGDLQPQKHEGDGRSPAGIFDIGATFGYSVDTNSTMPYFHADEKLICVDDVNDRFYNKMILLNPDTPPKSFENMHRNDGLYRYGAVIEYNRLAEKGRGSCIFFHLKRPDSRPTSGCSAMDEKPLLEMLSWLNPAKNPKLLQIPKSECIKYQKEFVGIECE
jgi:L,D-peptidoglycan transpeptidase YkuD (ErfK/YbiS/YcfS/YnhG family)